MTTAFLRLCHRRGDAAAAGAEVELPGRPAPSGGDGLDDVFDQRFGIGAGMRTSRVTSNSRLKMAAR